MNNQNAANTESQFLKWKSTLSKLDAKAQIIRNTPEFCPCFKSALFIP